MKQMQHDLQNPKKADLFQVFLLFLELLEYNLEICHQSVLKLKLFLSLNFILVFKFEIFTSPS